MCTCISIAIITAKLKLQAGDKSFIHVFSHSTVYRFHVHIDIVTTYMKNNCHRRYT